MNTNLIINGKNIIGLGEGLPVVNPANEAIIAVVPSATLDQVDEAIKSAKHAFQLWKDYPDESINTMFDKIITDIRKESDDIARLITIEQGKTFNLAKAEVEIGVNWIEYIKNLEIPIEEIEEPNGKKIKIYNRPLGVIASITPWNWPFMIAIWHLFPALKTKNCVLNKPSQLTPLSTIKLVEIINRHIPKGVCSIVLGKGSVLGDFLSAHPDISKVIFTGSTPVGIQILNTSSASLKSVVLELGGNDAGIVLNDIDVKSTAERIFASAFLNAGQTCAALKRLYVHEDVYDELVNRLIEIANSQVVGDGMDLQTTFGPVQNKDQYDYVRKLISNAVSAGGKIVTNNQKFNDKGFYISPTLITNVNNGVDLVDQEQFGPVLPVIKFTNIESAIELANDSNFGLGGSVWSSNKDKAEEVANKLECGTVWINSHSDLSPAAVFGGWKLSGLGFSFGLDGLLLFTHKQAIHIS